MIIDQPKSPTEPSIMRKRNRFTRKSGVFQRHNEQHKQRKVPNHSLWTCTYCNKGNHVIHRQRNRNGWYNFLPWPRKQFIHLPLKLLLVWHVLVGLKIPEEVFLDVGREACRARDGGRFNKGKSTSTLIDDHQMLNWHCCKNHGFLLLKTI